MVLAASVLSLVANILYMFGISGEPDHEEYTKEELATETTT